ncbi:hypothetical protein LSCM1_00917 [Leishmania martiniquensis]|uniref:Uncharacterized protein n=1 Tax=Leishmania martiniquensis TaxID=1580590 RepID=A0A836G2P1_9TRYP|nr:hypothetical protein LSCM1_00917 [Leishmania martiniquensis]
MHRSASQPRCVAGDAASCCSDLREMNEAKVANILSYLDSAAATHCEEQNMRDCTLVTSFSSVVPLTSSALQHVTASSPSSSSIAVSLHDAHAHHRASPRRSASPPSTHVPTASAVWITGGGAESAQNTYLGIKKRIEGMQFENEQLRRDNAELRSRLQQWRDEEARRKEEMREAVQGEVDELRRSHAQDRKRAKADVERLQKAKEELTHQVDALTERLREEAAKRVEDTRRLEATNAAALSSLRAKWAAQERASREKWRLAEAKRIKESTLQSLEPDIVLLLNRHKAEKARLREEYENELRQRDEVIAAKDASVEELKSKLRREAEELLSREQDAVRERLRDESERIHRQLEEERRLEQRRREELEHHFEDQKRTLQREIERLGKELLRLQSAQTTEQAAFHEAVTNEVGRITGEVNERMTSLKEKLMREFSEREKDTQEANQRYLHAKEAEMRKKCELERDAAVTKVVQRLEEEHLRALESARGSDGMLRERYVQVTREKERLQVELGLVQEQLSTALEANRSKAEELQRIQEMASLSEQHISAIEDKVRSEYTKRMSILDHEWQKKLHEFETRHVKEVWELQQREDAAKRDVDRLKSEFEMEKKTLEQRHHVELSQINERVLVAITKKESTIRHQAEQLLSLQEAVSVRDQELQRHRQLLL